jgi:hypothetical protein
VICEPCGLSSLLHAKPSPKASAPNTPGVRSFIGTSEGKRQAYHLAEVRARAYAPGTPISANSGGKPLANDSSTPSTTAQVREGGCQCGRVRYRVEGEPLILGICHCTECQRQSGSAFGMSMVTPKAQFTLLQGELKTFTRSSDSGRPVICAFCPECGTRIYHVPSYLQGVVNVKPGTLDDTSFIKPAGQGWTSSKQGWIDFGDLPGFERQP